MYRCSPFRSTLNTGYITGLDMCKVCTEAVHCVALWTRVTLGLGMCKVCTEAVHCVALWTRVTLGLGMCPCQVCTEARDATKNAKKKSPKAKTRPGKKGTKAPKGCVSGSANVPVCGYIYILWTYPLVYMISIHIAILDESEISPLVSSFANATTLQWTNISNFGNRKMLVFKHTLGGGRYVSSQEGVRNTWESLSWFSWITIDTWWWGKTKVQVLLIMGEDKHIPGIHITNPGKMLGDESAVIPKSLNKNYVVRLWSKTWVSGTFQDASYKQYIFPWGWKTFVWKKQFLPCDLHNIHYDNHTIIYISILGSWRLSLPSWPKTTRSGWPKPLGFLHKGDNTPSAAV